MFRTAKQYLKEELDIELPEGNISGSWFSQHDLPMVVECACCHSTMVLPSAMVDDNGVCFCSTCVE